MVGVGERLRLEAPLFLEVIRTGTELAASEVEQPHATLEGPSHDRPIHEIVDCDAAAAPYAARVIRVYFVPEVETHDRRERLPFLGYHRNFAIRSECLAQPLEPAPRQYRRAEVAHALRIDPVELGDIAVMACLQARMDTLANLVAPFHRDRLEIIDSLGNDPLPERDVKMFDGPVRLALLAVAQFEVIHL